MSEGAGRLLAIEIRRRSLKFNDRISRMEISMLEEVCLNFFVNEEMERLSQNSKAANDNLIDLAARSTLTKQRRIPIGSRTTSFNFVLYEILISCPQIKFAISLLIYP